MATASLLNFTVPLSTNQSASSQGLLMPKLKFRFRATFINFGISQPTTEMTKQVKDFTRPQLAFNPIEIPVYNSRVYLAGKPEWSACTVNLRDDMGGYVSSLVGQQVQKQFDFMEQASASSGIDYKFMTIIEVLDGGNGVLTPNVLETWELDGCFLLDVNYNNMDYSANDPMEIALQIRFDNAIQGPGEGIGSYVGRSLNQVATG
jgi:hypothetical protein